MNKEYMNNLVEFLKDVGMTASFVGKENGVPKMKSISLVAHFGYGDDEENRKRVYIRHTYTCDIEEEPNASVFCECLQRLLEYGAVMEEMLAGLSSGMGMEEILAAEQLGR